MKKSICPSDKKGINNNKYLENVLIHIHFKFTMSKKMMILNVIIAMKKYQENLIIVKYAILIDVMIVKIN